MAGNLAIRILLKIKRKIEFKRSIEYFINQNSSYWKYTVSNTEKIIFVELSERNPLELEYVFRISKTIQELTNSKIHVYYSGFLSWHSWFIRVINSYDVNKITGVTNIILKKPKIFFKSVANCFIFLKDIGSQVEKLEATSYRGVLIGDLVYDEYLRLHATGFCIDFNLRIYLLLLKAIIYVEIFQNEIISKRPSFMVLADRCYIKHGTFLRCGVYFDIPVYVPWRTIRVVDKNNLYDHPTHPGITLEEIECEVASSEVDLEVEKYIKKRFIGDINEIDVFTAFKDKKNLNRSEIVSLCKLDGTKKIALIMPHAFRDFPHISKSVYRDYHVWLRNLLEIARDITDVNWVIKPHPTSYLFGEVGEVERLLTSLNIGNIKVLPSHISTASVKDFADYILTVNGTAGLEFATFGIPVINAGRSPYSGFGFNIEAEDQDEYKNIITNIINIQKLSAEQIRRAKILFYYIWIRENVYPNYVLDGIDSSVKDYNLGFNNIVKYNLINPKSSGVIYNSTKRIFNNRNQY